MQRRGVLLVMNDAFLSVDGLFDGTIGYSDQISILKADSKNSKVAVRRESVTE